MLSSTPRWPDVETAELVVCTIVQTIPPSTALEVHTHSVSLCLRQLCIGIGIFTSDHETDGHAVRMKHE